MLIGYVSDELYVAIPDVAVEILRDSEMVATTHSTARGAIYAELVPGNYRVALAKPGYGAKWTDISIGDQAGPRQFRLMPDRLIGYAWPGWVRAGETTSLRVNCAEPYKAELWRYGAKKEFVRLLGWLDEHGPRAMTQVLPDGDFSIDGTHWNSVGFTASPYFIRRFEAPDRSGLYYVHVTSRSGAFFSFPLVVAPSRATAHVAVLAGTNTWNSYNSFGGRSNYINADGLPPTPTVNARQELARYKRGSGASQGALNDDYPPLSFDRPNIECHVPLEVQLTDPMEGRLASTLAPGTWRLLGWLEQHGWNYDLYSDHQLHTGQLELDSYRVLVLDMHPEYWSRGSYERVRDWVFERGGRLMYLGGNGIDCEVEFHGDLSARHLTQRIETSDPADEHLESRFHRTCESQARLLGVVFTSAGEGTAAPYVVVRPDHWVFAGTGLSERDRFGERSMHERVPGGASGHETDKRTPNSPPGVELLARGANPDEGGAEIVYFETGDGAVFSTGSITYISSLLVDDSVSRITENVLSRFAGAETTTTGDANAPGAAPSAG